MSVKDAHLYSVPKNKKRPHSALTSSATLNPTFSSSLSSLISTTSSAPRQSTGRSQRKKDDIFSTHNRNTSKRAKADLSTSTFTQQHSTNSDALDSEAWRRSQRKMEEKSRLYAAMKRGDLEDEEGKYAVDFDTKWADQVEGKEVDTSKWDNESSEGEGEAEEETVEWTDEFGRTRKGTRAEMQRHQRREKLASELDERIRPAAPDRVIYGDTVQSAAFNPDAVIADKMEELAKKRDRSLTPPPDMHFDGGKEVRSKGVGFMQFSHDKGEREEQMRTLERERAETERRRGEREKERERKIEERKAMIMERRKAIEAKRARKKADEFLDDLGKEMVKDKED